MKKIKDGYRKLGEFLVDWTGLDQPGKGRGVLREELMLLRTGSGETVREYCIRKVSTVLMVLTVGVFLSGISYAVYAGSTGTVEQQLLKRPGYGEGDRQEELEVEIDGEEVQQLEITVQERRYTEKEKEQLLEAAVEELEEKLIGDNETLDEVREDLVFPESFVNGAVTASWVTIPYGVIDENGMIVNVEQEDGVLVEIQATLLCGETEWVHSVYANVFPRILSAEESLKEEIMQTVERADAKESYEEALKLPEEIEGKKLIWKYPQENPFFTVLAFALLISVLIYFEMDSQIHKKAEERRNQLVTDYPDLLWKMTMLLGAGLTLKGTFLRMGNQYQREKRNVHYVYEEILYTCREMESGIAEAEAYERFGRRCQLPEYIRLGSLLSQNLKKGTRGLTALLEEEAAASMTERKNNARKLGERAGTKLLFPMILMLGIVMVILIVPAFLAF